MSQLRPAVSCQLPNIDFQDLMLTNPCTSCGACCASFRVDFAVDELQSSGGCVPDGLADALNHYTARMRGTDYASPRCSALGGQLGRECRCGIYEWRPNPCREFEAGTPTCNQARGRHGLAPLSA